MPLIVDPLTCYRLKAVPVWLKPWKILNAALFAELGSTSFASIPRASSRRVRASESVTRG